MFFFFFFRGRERKREQVCEKGKEEQKNGGSGGKRLAIVLAVTSVSLPRFQFIPLFLAHKLSLPHNTHRTSAELAGLRSRMNDASRARAAPGAGAAASERATERAAEVEGVDLDCPPPPRALLLLLLLLPLLLLLLLLQLLSFAADMAGSSRGAQSREPLKKGAGACDDDGGGDKRRHTHVRKELLLFSFSPSMCSWSIGTLYSGSVAPASARPLYLPRASKEYFPAASRSKGLVWARLPPVCTSHRRNEKRRNTRARKKFMRALSTVSKRREEEKKSLSFLL